MQEEENVDKALNEAKNQISDGSIDLSWWLLFRGILILLIGIFAIAWPKITIGILVKGFGAFMLLDGILGAIVSFQSGWKKGGPLASLLGIILGATLLFATVVSVRFFLALIGGWAFIQGIAIVFTSQDKSDPNSRKLFGISGGALAIIGLVLLVWPVTGVVAVSWLLGCIGLLAGIGMITVSFFLRRFANWVQEAN